MKKLLPLLMPVLFMLSCSKNDPPIVTKHFKNVYINRVELLQYPLLKSNSRAWDDNAVSDQNPDISFTIGIPGPALHPVGGVQTVNDVTPAMLPVVWNGTPITHILEQDISGLDFTFYDYDGIDSVENMGTISFNLAALTTGSHAYPATTEITSPLFKLKLYFEWSDN